MGGSASKRDRELSYTSPIGGLEFRGAVKDYEKPYCFKNTNLLTSETDKFLCTNPMSRGLKYPSDLTDCNVWADTTKNTDPIAVSNFLCESMKFPPKTSPMSSGFGFPSETEKFLLNTDPMNRGIGFESESMKFLRNTSPMSREFGLPSDTGIGFLNTDPMNRGIGFESESMKFLPNTSPMSREFGLPTDTGIGFLNTDPMNRGFGFKSETEKFLLPNTGPIIEGFGFQGGTKKFQNIEGVGKFIGKQLDDYSALRFQNQREDFPISLVILKRRDSIRRAELKAGDHIYAWRKTCLYAHHGIYMGDDKVVHFNAADGQKSGYRDIADTCPSCGAGKNKTSNGVIRSCLDCFIDGDELCRYEYSVSWIPFIAAVRSGTGTTAESDPPEVVLRRANESIEKGFQGYNFLLNNCEAFAFYCKTGRAGVPFSSGQLSHALGIAAKMATGSSFAGILVSVVCEAIRNI